MKVSHTERLYQELRGERHTELLGWGNIGSKKNLQKSVELFSSGTLLLQVSVGVIDEMTRWVAAILCQDEKERQLYFAQTPGH